MSGRDVDIAIAGGGLAGGLLALSIHRAHPDMRILLLEAGEALGGNHRWSWFASDLDEDGKALMAPFPKAEWKDGYEVRFPAYRRQLGSSYLSLASADFDRTLREFLPAEAVRTGSRVAALEDGRVTLENGETILSRAVIDCRDFEASGALAGGWQLFLGQHIRTHEPHGLTRPVIMDATVEQLSPFGNDGAYRFVYVLPLGPDEIFVEDTYYALDPKMDRELLQSRTQAYVRDNGWAGEVIGQEAGVLPVVTAGDFGSFQADRRVYGVALAGARGLFTHPLTSYTLPIAVENALAIAKLADLPGPELAARVENRARKHWDTTAYYRALGRMLFDAAEPDQRYRVFERFYRLRAPLIERFYAAHSTPFDKLRILVGRPPVSVTRAITALLGKGRSLVQGTRP